MKKFFNMRRLKYGSNSLVLIISVIGIVILFNIFVYGYNFRIDMTKNKLYTLSDKTDQVLENLEKEVEIIGFFKEDSALLPDIAELLKEYKNKTNNIKYSLIDMDSNPVKARAYEVTDYDTVVFMSGDKIIKIRRNDFYELDYRTVTKVFAGEEKVTQAILDVTLEKQNKAYLLQGHGELAGDNIHWFESAIKGEGYNLEYLNLAQNNGVPEDADLLIIAGPTKDYSLDELWYLTQYTDNGGRILVLMRQFYNENGIVNLSAYIESLGVKVNNDVIIDPERNYFNDPVTIIPQYKDHSIVRKLHENGLYLLMPGSLSIEKSRFVTENDTFEPLLETSSKAWGETNLSDNDIELDENDNKGPLTVAAAITRPVGLLGQKQMKAVVIGNTVIATNELINEQGNIDFLVNAINYIQDKEQLISIRPKNRVMEPLTLQGNQGTLLYMIFVVAIPAAVFITGLIIFIRRRRR